MQHARIYRAWLIQRWKVYLQKYWVEPPKKALWKNISIHQVITRQANLLSSLPQLLNRLLEVSKTNYLKEKLSTSNMKQLFKLVDGMFSVKSSPTLPRHDSLEHLVASFGYLESSNLKSSISDVLSLALGLNVWLMYRASLLSVSLITSLRMVSRLSFSHPKVKVALSIQYLLGCYLLDCCLWIRAFSPLSSRSH